MCDINNIHETNISTYQFKRTSSKTQKKTEKVAAIG